MILLEILFLLSVGALLHSYVVFPFILDWMARGKTLRKMGDVDYSKPIVSIVMAAYNEEKVIREKIESFLQTSYPTDKIELIIGSDGSTDKTEQIIESYQIVNPNIFLYKFSGRTGKSGILNQIIPTAKGSIIILTDANIYFDKSMVHELVLNFHNTDVGLVGANIQNTGMRKVGISIQEKTYIQRENRIKYNEGIVWGCMMGAFGACYAVRKELINKIPANHLMEDFFVSMHVLKAGHSSVLDLHAIAFEDVSNMIKEEFRRKVRISAGNFQNLSLFYSMLWPVYKPIGFSFLSHKIIRWFGPVLILICMVSSGILAVQNIMYALMFLFLVFLLLSPVIDWILARLNIHNFVIRLIAYFVLMNLALLVGLVMFLKGIKTSAWKPTIRNVK